MQFEFTSHRHGIDIVQSNRSLSMLWEELKSSITNLDDDSLKASFLGSNPVEYSTEQIPALKQFNAGETFHGPVKGKSLAKALNEYFRNDLKAKSWVQEAAIFQGEEFQSNFWRLDFSKVIDQENDIRTGMAVEVAFNHGEAIAWNLLKPKIASEMNHVKKAVDIGEGIGVMICANRALKESGGFDNTVGEYEKVVRYLKPLESVLTIPMIIIGLQPPETFEIFKYDKSVDSRKDVTGIVVPKYHGPI